MITKSDVRSASKEFSNQIGIWGIGCTAMAELFDVLCKRSALRLAYADVKHVEVAQCNLWEHNKEVYQLGYTSSKQRVNTFLNEADVVLVNGNHNQCSTMWLVLDGKKNYRDDAKKEMHTSIIFYIDATAAQAKEIAKKCAIGVSLIPLDGSETLLNQLDLYYKNIKPGLVGIVLAGGQSKRMGQQKSELAYHSKPQWKYMVDLIKPYCEEVRVSCSMQNSNLYEDSLTDIFNQIGPLGGIFTALKLFKNKAVLVLACDMPLFDKEALLHLLQNRDVHKVATAYKNSSTGFTEPLAAIYEPKVFICLLELWAMGHHCPRKMLDLVDTHYINPLNNQQLLNVNNQEERKQVEILIQQLTKARML